MCFGFDLCGSGVVYLVIWLPLSVCHHLVLIAFFYLITGFALFV